jgi:acetylglutamate kinase
MKQRVLIKIGGKAFEGKDGFKSLAKAIKSNKNAEFIIVHGGGAEISQALKESDRKTEFIDGIRVTHAEDIKIVEDVLSGKVNKRIASILDENGVLCKRMSGKTGRLFIVEPLIRNKRNFGYVGKIKQVNAKPVLHSLTNGQVPVVSPISADEKGASYNVNADSAAAALAVGSQCTDLIYFTDVPGVRVGKETRPSLTVREAKGLLADGTIKAGMVAKMESVFEALNGKVKRVHITQWHGEETLKNIIKNKSIKGTTIQL